MASVAEFRLSNLIHPTRHSSSSASSLTGPGCPLFLSLARVGRYQQPSTNWLAQKCCCLAQKPRQLPSSATAPLPYQLQRRGGCCCSIYCLMCGYPGMALLACLYFDPCRCPHTPLYTRRDTEPTCKNNWTGVCVYLIHWYTHHVTLDTLSHNHCHIYAQGWWCCSLQVLLVLLCSCL